MKAVVYARYSSGTQTELSIEGQLKVCHEYAAANGLEIMAEYIDRAMSGRVAINRPEFVQMLEDSALGTFEVVLVYQLDRFARSRHDSAMFKFELRCNGVRVVSARETISDDASGILMESVLEGMAEYYSCELSQKVRRGLTLNAEKGLYTGAGVPPGYRVDNKQFVIDEDTALLVRRVFHMYLMGERIADIAREVALNKHRVRRILTNRRYTGVYIYGRVEIPGGIPQIIDEKTFLRVQRKLGRDGPGFFNFDLNLPPLAAV